MCTVHKCGWVLRKWFSEARQGRRYKQLRTNNLGRTLQIVKSCYLFDIQSEPVFKTHQPTLNMSADALVAWKTRIFEYQQQVKANQPAVQQKLFDLTPTHVDPDSIDPFSLTLQPMSFYRMPIDGPGEACLYFVIDNALPLLLYVGETCQSNKRWKGTHDCKGYLTFYENLHRLPQLKTAVCMTFWWDTPLATKPRQQL